MSAADRDDPDPEQHLRWLLITVSTGASSTLRVHSWRKLRSLGAVYLQQSVALLPDCTETRKEAVRLAQRVRDGGGDARVLPIEITDAEHERQLIDQFQDERADEYREVLDRAPELLRELDHERARGRITYPELEESEADLKRFRTWLQRIDARDYFHAPGRADAFALLEQCEHALTDFETSAISAELGDSDARLTSDGPRAQT